MRGVKGDAVVVVGDSVTSEVGCEMQNKTSQDLLTSQTVLSSALRRQISRH